jgi:hypothetical protein
MLNPLQGPLSLIECMVYMFKDKKSVFLNTFAMTQKLGFFTESYEGA